MNIIDTINRLETLTRELKEINEKLESVLRELQSMYPPQGEPIDDKYENLKPEDDIFDQLSQFKNFLKI